MSLFCATASIAACRVVYLVVVSPAVMLATYCLTSVDPAGSNVVSLLEVSIVYSVVPDISYPSTAAYVTITTESGATL